MTLAVVLAVRSFSNTGKTMAFYNTLESFTFCQSHYIHFFAFSENVGCNCITNIFFLEIVCEFFYALFSCSISFSEVVLF